MCSGLWAPRFLGVDCSRHVFRPVWALPSAWDFSPRDFVFLKGAQTLIIEFCWGQHEDNSPGDSTSEGA